VHADAAGDGRRIVTGIVDIDIRTAPLGGTTLVEANAGTGKTWTVAALYVRLLLEVPLDVERILVLTFGVAATAELKTRIRNRVVDLRDLLATRPVDALAEDDDALIAWLGRTIGDVPRAVARLSLAAESFDQAPVFTLHGFCQRVLTEHAFESGAPFVAELAPDETALIDEVAQDFWRRETAAGSPLWLRWLAAEKINPDALAKDIVAFGQRPYAQVVGPDAPDDEVLTAYADAFEAAQREWRGGGDDLRALIRSLMRADWARSRTAKLDAVFADGVVLPPREKHRERDQGWVLSYFTPADLAAKTKKAVLPHAFFVAAERLCACTDALRAALLDGVAALRARLAVYARDELARRKRERALVGYGDLVTRLRDALDGPQGDRLAATLRERYPAALLDEFQDTDPVQAAIFKRIYHGAAGPVYLVGDPKQAIYGFRGADVHAYLDAGRAADARYTLRRNWRSVSGQIDAVNAVFSRQGAFLDDDITFSPSERGTRQHAAIALRHDFPAPFTFWFIPDAAGKPAGKGDANDRSADATADAIASLLAPGAAKLGADDLQGRDIAVLVPSHRQGGLVRKALRRRGIASVTYGSDSVYASEEAAAVERILLAVAEPGREGLVRDALATALLGADAASLCRYDDVPAEWDRLQARFAGYRDRAAARGFVRMWRELLEAEGVPARLLALPDGERRLTNVRHLSELLQDAADAGDLDVSGLARLLGREREVQARGGDAHLLRLESDEGLVRILTVHASKGLEFPIVFCPFLWDGQLRAGDNGLAFCHEDGGALIDTGTDRFDTRVAAARGEELAERVRLAYVALTRASHRCIVAWGCVSGAEDAALAGLLHGARGEDFKARSADSLRADLAALAASSGGSIAVIDLPELRGSPVDAKAAADTGPLAARPFTGAIAPAWRVSSFSGLVARRALETPDHDALPAEAVADLPPPLPDGPGRTAFDFPGGVRIGTMVHALFERIDFADPEGGNARTLVEQTLAAHDVDASWAPVVHRMLVDVLATPIDAAGMALRSIAPDARLAELEFVFPVDAGAPQLVPGAAPPRGFMKGYIDLVFTAGGRWYVLDWKSNRLGGRRVIYKAPRLEEAMRASFYDLQYRLYTVALHRHLQARLPGYDYDAHFGGVFYLFVRGMRPANGPATGVYFARPGREEIETLSRQVSDVEAA